MDVTFPEFAPSTEGSSSGARKGSREECEDIVMIADNWSTPRDLNLLTKINKPIKIILCGTEYGVNSIYLDVAHQTGGSVHTIEQDIQRFGLNTDNEETEMDNASI